MTVKPRTIDNLGIETSRRYARDKEQLEESKLIEDSKFIPQKTEVSVLKPYFPPELQEYLLPTPQTIWAAFEAPPEYMMLSSPLFTYQLVPSLGDSGKQEANTDKLEALEDTLSKSFKEGKKQGRNQDQQDEQEEEKERKTLLHLLKTIGKFDRTLQMINSRRNQYQRG